MMKSCSLDMSRPVSRCKWKEVLGYDDEHSSARHSRSQSTSTSTSTSSHQSSTYSWSPQIIFQPSLPTYPRLPRDITFFRSRHDILLAPSSPAPSSNDLKPLPPPPHLFYITVQRPSSSESSPSPSPSSSFSGKSTFSSSNYKQHVGRPDLILHSGPSKANTVISYAKFLPETGETEITLCPPAPKAVSANFSTLDLPLPSSDDIGHSRSPSTSTSSSLTSYSSTSSTSTSSCERRRRRTGFRTETLIPSHPHLFQATNHTFHHAHPSSSKRERFEWRYTSGPFLRENDRGRESGGLKLVRCETGEVVAVYAGLGEGADRDRKRSTLR